LKANGGAPVQSVILPGQLPSGQPILSLLVKRTYVVRPGASCERAAADRKLISGDQHFNDPLNTTVKFESDFVPFKLATDVVLNGRAVAPGGQRVTSLSARVEVGGQAKEVLIVGNRHCRYRAGREPIFTEPEDFTSLELRYEQAYGGVDAFSDPDLPSPYVRNPLGRGFVVLNRKESIENLPLPNLEDPADALTPARLCAGHIKDWEQQPMPQSFGWLQKSWRQRAQFAGVMPGDRALESQLRRIYVGAVPLHQRKLYQATRLPEMDFRFFNGASSGLAIPNLCGDEEIKLTNLHEINPLTFRLPADIPRLGLDIGGGVQVLTPALHTVMIRTEDGEVDLVWRGALPYQGLDWLPELKKMEALVE
jgi:hypothetical protein